MSEPQKLPAPESFQTVATARTTRARIRAAAAATMRKIISSKNRLRRLHAAVLRYPLQPLRKYVMDFAKRYFDILKNLLVVAGIFIISSKSKSYILHIFAWVSLFVFMIDCLISPFFWEQGPFDRAKSKIWRVSLNVLFAVVAGVALVVVFWAIVFMLEEFVRAQSH
jgi:hypothetical protein